MPEGKLRIHPNTANARPVESQPTEFRRPPWRPRVAGLSAMFLGPVAGGIVCAVNFRRLGKKKKALPTVVCSLLVTLLFVTLMDFVLPENEPLIRIFGLGILIAGFATFSNLQENDFETWSGQYQDSEPANGWSSLG
jgi:hypothetical protein